MSVRRGSVSFDCSVCLEPLDAPSSIEINAAENDGTANDAGASNDSPQAGTSTGRGTGRSRRGRKPCAIQNSNCLTDVVSTHCGHLYHNVCLQRWFTGQGKKTCPSCRKAVPLTKLIKLFPTSSNGAGGPSPCNAGSTSSVTPAAAAPQRPINVPVVVQLNGNGDIPIPVEAAGCTEPQCRYQNYVHTTLINDHEDLRQQFYNLEDDNQLKQAQIASLEEQNQKMSSELQELKRQIQNVPAQSQNAKRKRAN